MDWPAIQTRVVAGVISAILLSIGATVGHFVFRMTAVQMAWGGFVGGGVVALWVFQLALDHMIAKTVADSEGGKLRTDMTALAGVVQELRRWCQRQGTPYP